MKELDIITPIGKVRFKGQEIPLSAGGGENFKLYNYNQTFNEDGTCNIELTDYDGTSENTILVGQLVDGELCEIYFVDNELAKIDKSKISLTDTYLGNLRINDILEETKDLINYGKEKLITKGVLSSASNVKAVLDDIDKTGGAYTITNNYQYNDIMFCNENNETWGFSINTENPMYQPVYSSQILDFINNNMFYIREDNRVDLVHVDFKNEFINNGNNLVVEGTTVVNQTLYYAVYNNITYYSTVNYQIFDVDGNIINVEDLSNYPYDFYPNMFVYDYTKEQLENMGIPTEFVEDAVNYIKNVTITFTQMS